MTNEETNERGHQFFSKRRPFRPNHNEVFGLERDFGPCHGLDVGEFDPDDEEE
jgi:hypothetical protein